MVNVSVLIPTYNEELNLPDCLNSVAGWTNDIWVVDSFSTDSTIDVARKIGASVVQHPFESYSRQKNWALDNLPLKNEWVLILDADERLLPDLASEIEDLVAKGGAGCDGFYLNRRFIFYGKWIRHCGWYPSWNLRLFRRDRGRYEDRRLHEHLILDGKAGYCKNDLIHQDLRDMSFWIAKHNEYSSQEARELLRVMRGEGVTGFRPSLFGNSLERKRFLKERVWPHLPGRSLVYFLYLYVFRFGFLDGKEGLIFCSLHAMFEQFNSAKLWELQNCKETAPAATTTPQSPSPLVAPIRVGSKPDRTRQ